MSRTEAQVLAEKKYRLSDKYKEKEAKYRKSKVRKEYLAKYTKTEEYLAKLRKYRNTDKFREYDRKLKVKERLKPGFYKKRAVADKKLKEKSPTYKLSVQLRTRMHRFIKGGSPVKDLGCSLEELKTHLEIQFKEGMIWSNWSRTGWHIDHIIPLSSFDLTDREQFLKAVHYTNLQPLWAKDNIAKSNKIS